MSIVAAQAWLHAFGWTLVHFLWQGALIGLAYAIVRALLPREHSEARYAAGLAALATLAVCPPVTLWLLRPLAAPLVATGSAALAGFAISPSATAGAGAFAALDLSWLVAAWVAGVVVMTARAIHQWRALERIASGLAWRQDDIEALFARVAARFGGIRRVRVLVSRHIDTPTLIGWFNPVVLLPAAVVLGFPRHQLELILAHELGHLRRYDHLVNLGQAAIETLLFYHPVVHLISREVRHEREICCDRLVLRLTEGEPHEYARTLAALEDLRQLPPQLAVAASGGRLLDRVRRIVGSPSPRGRRLRGTWIVLAVGTGVLAVALAASRWSDETRQMQVVSVPSKLPGVDEPPLSVAPIEPLPALVLLPRLEAPGATVRTQAAVDVAAVPAVDAQAEAASVVTTVVSVPSPAAADMPVAGAGKLDVADLGTPVAPIIEAPSARVERAPRSAPRLVRRVDPAYPEVSTADSRGHVEFEFAVDRDGLVRDISVVSGDARGMFANAARHALRQWRFDPRTAGLASGQRFRQDFVFVGISRGLAEDEDAACHRSTGSHLCRPSRALGLITETEVGQGMTKAREPAVAAIDAAPIGAAGTLHAALPSAVAVDSD